MCCDVIWGGFEVVWGSFRVCVCVWVGVSTVLSTFYATAVASIHNNTAVAVVQ